MVFHFCVKCAGKSSQVWRPDAWQRNPKKSEAEFLARKSLRRSKDRIQGSEVQEDQRLEVRFLAMEKTRAYLEIGCRVNEDPEMRRF